MSEISTYREVSFETNQSHTNNYNLFGATLMACHYLKPATENDLRKTPGPTFRRAPEMWGRHGMNLVGSADANLAEPSRLSL